MKHPVSQPRGVKVHRNYSVEEAAQAVGVHKNTIREWIRRGLPVIDDRRPILILGRELVDYIRRRRTSNKKPCGPGQLYCVRCRRPQCPAGGMADLVSLKGGTGNLVGLCPTCGTLMYRRVSLSKFASARGALEVRVLEAVQHIGESLTPSVNHHFVED